MRRFQRSERGLSEIVGTLMLVVIVVTAATLLAAFVATYQQQLQTEQAFTHAQSLESLHVLGLTTAVANGDYRSFGFTLASKYVDPSLVMGVSLDNQPIKAFNWTDLDTGATGSFVLGEQLNLGPFEQAAITLDLNSSSSNFSFLAPNEVPLPNEFLKFDVFTQLQNDFSQVYLPPTALAVASEINPSGSSPIILFDGTMSFQSGGNATIVQWNWTATDQLNHTAVVGPLLGEEVELSPSNFTASHPYWVNLTVTNSAGLDGTTSITWTAP
jgi:flagellin-like protein